MAIKAEGGGSVVPAGISFSPFNRHIVRAPEDQAPGWVKLGTQTR